MAIDTFQENNDHQNQHNKFAIMRLLKEHERFFNPAILKAFIKNLNDTQLYKTSSTNHEDDEVAVFAKKMKEYFQEFEESLDANYEPLPNKDVFNGLSNLLGGALTLSLTIYIYFRAGFNEKEPTLTSAALASGFFQILFGLVQILLALPKSLLRASFTISEKMSNAIPLQMALFNIKKPQHSQNRPNKGVEALPEEKSLELTTYSSIRARA